MRICLFMILLMNAALAPACEPQEAQFIGKVKNISEIQKSEVSSECSFQIEVSTYNMSGTCPLDIDFVQPYVFQDLFCTKKNGDAVSGILVRTGSFIIIE